MRVKLDYDKEGNIVLPLPYKVCKELGWDIDDNLVIDIPVTGQGTMLIYKADRPEVKLVATSTTDKSREYKDFGEQ